MINTISLVNIQHLIQIQKKSLFPLEIRTFRIYLAFQHTIRSANYSYHVINYIPNTYN